VPESSSLAMGRRLVILEVNFMIKSTMRGHVLALLMRTHRKKSPCRPQGRLWRRLCLIGGKGLRVQSRHWSGLVADGSQGHNVQIITSQLDINGVYLFTRI